MSSSIEIPTSHKILSILAIIWNLFGVMSFAAHAFMPEASFAEMTADQREYMEAFPSWAYIVFGTAVTTGVLGSMGLLLKKKWAVMLFLISLITVLINQLHPFIATNYMEIFGGISTLWMPAAIIGIALTLYLYARSCDAKGWLS